MHPILAEQLAAQHVTDMRAEAAVARRARLARRARRGPVVVGLPTSSLHPCPQLPCPPPVVRPAVTARAA